MTEPAALTGVILAGGLSRRMEGPEKTLLELAGKPLIAHVRDRLARQIAPVLVNANGDPARFAFLGLPVVADTVSGFAGPLAGTLAAMEWLIDRDPELADSDAAIVTVAGDTPFFPADLVARLGATRDASQAREATIAMAFSGGNRHPTFALWPIALAGALRHFLAVEMERKVMLFAQRYRLVRVEFEAGADRDPFFNINTPGDLATAEALLSEAVR
ncbi:MAG: molybdenum cofactor guanylyltransferase MobA [Nitratireductor sp.]|nr:molybdenum cofactor guanylyltransferase MobA [Nitratireductor sp.]